MRLNGVNYLRHLRDFSETRFERPRWRDNFVPLLDLLSSVSQLAPGDYIAAHSMIPYMDRMELAGVRAKSVPQRFLGPFKPDLHLHLAHWYPTTWRCCKRCIEEDGRKFGFAWFRREHNVIGIDWCLEHGTPLLVTATDPPYLADLVEELASDALVELSPPYEKFVDAPKVVQRFVESQLALGRCSRQMTRASAAHALRDRARPIPWPEAAAPRLSDLAVLSFPAEWIDWTFSDSLRSFRGLDDVFKTQFKKGSQNYFYSLAVALLFHDAQAGAETLADTHLDGKSSFRRLSSQLDRAAVLKRGMRDQYEWRISCLAEILRSESCAGISDAAFDGSDEAPLVVAIKQSPTMKALVAIGDGMSIDSARAKFQPPADELEAMLRRPVAQMLRASWAERPVGRADRKRSVRRSEVSSPSH